MDARNATGRDRVRAGRQGRAHRSACAALIWLALALQTLAPVPARAATSPEEATGSIVKILVRVKLTFQDGTTMESDLSTGSGFAVAPGIVATNRHVIVSFDPKDATATVRDLMEENGLTAQARSLKLAELSYLVVHGAPDAAQFSPAQPLADRGAFDLALLRHTLPLSPLRLAQGVQRGGPVVALGYPGVLDASRGGPIRGGRLSDPSQIEELTYAPGFVNKLERFPWGHPIEGERQPVVVHSAPIAPGNSGGPLLDACGDVVGINTAGLEGTEFKLAGSVELLAQFLAEQSIPFARATGPCGPGMAAARASGLSALSAGGEPLGLGGTNVVVLGAASVLVFALLAALIFVLARRKAEGRAAAGPSGRAGGAQATANGSTRLMTAHELAPAVSPEAALLTLTPEGGRQGPFRADLVRFATSDLGLVLGRDPDLCDFVLAEESFSRRHVRFVHAGGLILVEDLNSRNGTMLNGARLAPFQRTPLPDGAELVAGALRFAVEVRAAEASGRSAASARRPGAVTEAA